MAGFGRQRSRRVPATHAVILAGGRASRLGSVVTDVGKTHVSIAGQPMLAHQLSVLVAHGVERATVVAGPANAHAVRSLVDRCLGGHPLEVTVAVQQRPGGPGHALQTALPYVPDDETLLLVLADTWFDDLPPLDHDWIGVRPAPFERRWCAVAVRDDDVVDSFEDRVVRAGESAVAVGLYHLTRVAALCEIAADVVADPDAHGELELSDLLGPYAKEHETRVADIASWRDCGDLDGVLSARRAQFFTRSFNRLSLDTRGVLRKAGASQAFRDEAAFLRSLLPSRQAFFPRIFSIADDLTSYQMEYLDLPTMSEVYLYRPAPDGWWALTLRRMLGELSRHFWMVGDGPVEELDRRSQAMYVDKLWKRWRMVRHAHPAFGARALLINGEPVPGGESCVEWLAAVLTGLTSHSVPAFVHGDLNFSNILHSPATGIFRLVDPRGEFGGQAHPGDLRYDLAKLRHSYAGLYDAIVHGLYRLRVENTSEISFQLGPDRTREVGQLDDVLTEVVPDLYAIRAIECSLFLSMLPLHGDDPRRQLALFTRGMQLIAALRTAVDTDATAAIA